jgi:hypothetical protein
MNPSVPDQPPAEHDYEQPTWSTSSGARAPASGPGGYYGQRSGPPPIRGGGNYSPKPPKRRSNPLIIIIVAAALALLLILTGGALAFSQGIFSGHSSSGVAQRPTSTTGPAATDTATPEPTATNTPEPTATDTPVPPTDTPVPTFQVTGITLSVSPKSWDAPCEATQWFNFAGAIIMNEGHSGGTVTYYWLRSDGVTSTPVSVTVRPDDQFLPASTTWILDSAAPNGTYGETIVVTAPNDITSYTSEFTKNC